MVKLIRGYSGIWTVDADRAERARHKPPPPPRAPGLLGWSFPAASGREMRVAESAR